MGGRGGAAGRVNARFGGAAGVQCGYKKIRDGEQKLRVGGVELAAEDALGAADAEDARFAAGRQIGSLIEAVLEHGVLRNSVVGRRPRVRCASQRRNDGMGVQIRWKHR